MMENINMEVKGYSKWAFIEKKIQKVDSTKQKIKLFYQIFEVKPNKDSTKKTNRDSR